MATRKVALPDTMSWAITVLLAVPAKAVTDNGTVIDQVDTVRMSATWDDVNVSSDVLAAEFAQATTALDEAESLLAAATTKSAKAKATKNLEKIKEELATASRRRPFRSLLDDLIREAVQDYGSRITISSVMMR